MPGPYLFDRVKETTTSTTSPFSLLGAVSGFKGFVETVGNNNTCYYCIEHQTAPEWEVGIGTVTDSAPDTLTRVSVLASSNNNLAVTFSAGTKNAFVTIPAAATLSNARDRQILVGRNDNTPLLTDRPTIAGITLAAQDPAVVPFTVDAADAQTANLVQVLDAAGVVVLRQDASGRLGLGSPAPTTLDALVHIIQPNNVSVFKAQSDSNTVPSLSLFHHITSTSNLLGGALTFFRSAGTIASPTGALDTYAVGTVRWRAYIDASTDGRVAEISALCDGSPGVGSTPGKVVIRTTPSGSTTPADRITVAANGLATVSAGLLVTPASISGQALILRGLASQTEDLLEFQDSAGATKLAITKDGVLQGNNDGGGAIILRENGGNNIFRGLRSTGWPDSVSSTFFQIGVSDDNILVTAAGGSQPARFGIAGVTTQIARYHYTQLPAPLADNYVLELLTNNATKPLLALRGFTAQSGHLLAALDSSNAIVFAIEADGDLRTSRSSTGTTLGSVVRKLPLYNAAGSLLGYVPIYDNIT